MKIYYVVVISLFFAFFKLFSMDSHPPWPKPNSQLDDRQLTKIIYETQNLYFTQLPNDVKNLVFDRVQSNHVRADIQKYTPYFVLTHSNPLINNVGMLGYLSWENIPGQNLMNYNYSHNISLLGQLYREHNKSAMKKLKDCSLFIAAARGQMAKVKNLVAQGANCQNYEFNKGCGAIHAATQYGHLEVVRFLIECGVDCNASTNSAIKPFIPADQINHGKVVRFLLQQQDRVDCAVKSLGNYTPLFMASQNGYADLVQELIDAGAELDAEVFAPDNKATPLYVAAHFGQLAVAQKLVTAGANKNWTNGASFPLLIAAMNNHWQMVKFLIKSGARFDMKAPDGSMVIHVAADGGHKRTVARLLAAGARDQVNNAGCTGLYLASQNGHKKVVKALLAAGSDKNCVGVNGLKAIDAARNNGHTDIVKLLDGK